MQLPSINLENIITPILSYCVQKNAKTIDFLTYCFKFDPNSKIVEYEAEILKLTGSNHAVVAARVIAHFIADKSAHEDKPTEEEGQKIFSQILLHRRELVVQLIHVNLMKSLIKILKRIDEKQKNKDFLPHLALRTVEATSSYFERLQLITNGEEYQRLMQGKEKVDQDTEEYLRKELSKKIGTTLPIFPNGMGIKNIMTPEGEKDRKDGIYKVFREALLEIMLPDSGSLELCIKEYGFLKNWANSQRESTYETIKENLLTILHSAFSELSSSSSIDSLALEALNKFTAPETVQDGLKKLPEINQSRLETLKEPSRDFVASLSKMFPAPLVKLFFHLSSIEKETGEILSKQILTAITPPPLDADGNTPQSLNLIHLINSGIERSLDSFHSGEWKLIDENNLRKFKFQPQKVKWIIDPNDPTKGKQQKRIEKEKFSFSDSFTSEGIEQSQKEKAWNDVIQSINLQKKIDEVLDEQFFDLLPNSIIKTGKFLLSIVKPIVQFALIFTVLPLFYWKEVSNALDEISDILKATAKAILVDILWRKTFLHAPWKGLLENQRNQAIKVLHIPTHDVLFLTIANIFIQEIYSHRSESLNLAHAKAPGLKRS